MEVKFTPLVSVIMATFNERPSYIQEAVDSILTQTYKNIELFILDDSVNEESRSIIDELAKDPRIRLIRKSERMGLSGARNIGLKEASGKYIAIMDSDDIALPNRFERQVDYLEHHPECFVLGGQLNIINEEGTIISERHYPLKGIKLKLFATYRNPIAHPTVMFRSELYKKGFLYNENLEMSEDLDFWLRIMTSNYEIRNLNEIVINYRVGNNFAEKRSSSKQKEYMAYVRNKNWSNSHILFSVASVIAGMIFKMLPNSALIFFYKNENKQ